MQYLAAHSRLAVIGLRALMTLSAVGIASADQVVNLLPNGGAERVDSTSGEPVDWSMASVPAKGLRMWRDTEVRRRGEASFAILNEHEYEENVANNWVHELRYVPRGRMVRVRGYVRTKGSKSANICVQCWGADGEQMVGFASTPVLRGTKEWTQVESERIVVPEKTAKVVVRAALAGRGSVWFDDVKLDIVGPPVVSDPGLASAVPGRIVRRLPVEKDSMILAYIPEWNHGNVDNIAVAGNDGGVRTLMAWRRPAAADVSAAQHKFLLALYCREARGETEKASVKSYEVTQDWPEIVSWKERPATAEQPTAEAELHRSKGWKLIDVTPLVRRAASVKEWHGVMLQTEPEDFDSEKAFKEGKERCSDFRFVSREGIGEWENRRPALLVVDPNQPPVEEPAVAQPPAVEAPALATEEFLQYIEYLASLPESSVRPLPGARDAEFAAQQASGKAMEKVPGLGLVTPQEQWISIKSAWIPPYERFAAAYPLTPEGVSAMSGNLTELYIGAEQPDAAKRLAAAACQLARGSEMEYLAEINRAWVQKRCGEGEAAEARLRRVTAAELPVTRDRRTLDILWLAPSNLGDLLYEQKKYAEAEAVYIELIDAIEKWIGEHPEDKEVAISYALSAQRGRINIVLDEDLDDDAAVQRLVEEFERRFPGYADPHTGSAAAALRENVVARRQLRDQRKAVSQDATP